MKKLFDIKLFKIGLDPYLVSVACNIGSHADSYQLSLSQISLETGISIKKIRKCLHSLEKMNIIKINEIVGESSKYVLLDEMHWIIESNKNRKNTENIIDDGTPLPSQGSTPPLPSQGSTPLPSQGRGPLPQQGSTINRKELGKKNTITFSFEKPNEEGNFSKDFKKPEKPKLRSRGYTRIAKQFLAITASSGWDTEKVKGWANILCDKHGTELVEANIKRFYENPAMLQKSISMKPSLKLFTAIASGSF